MITLDLILSLSKDEAKVSRFFSILLVPHQPARLTPMTETVGPLSAAFYNTICRQQRGRLLYGAQ